MNERTHTTRNIPLLKSITSFETPAIGLEKTLPPSNKGLRKLKPPARPINPNSIAICIQILFLAGQITHATPIRKTGRPNIAGIQDVIDWKLVNTDATEEQTIKNKP
jgi:hypothetical protein